MEIYFGKQTGFSSFTNKHVGVSKNNGTRKSSILIGFSIIFTIHFGVPLFLETSMYFFHQKKHDLFSLALRTSHMRIWGIPLNATNPLRGSKAFFSGIMVVDNPLIRPYFIGCMCHWGGVPLNFDDPLFVLNKRRHHFCLWVHCEALAFANPFISATWVSWFKGTVNRTSIFHWRMRIVGKRLISFETGNTYIPQTSK